MDPNLIQALFDKGPIGVCALLALVVVGLWRENKALNNQRFDYADKTTRELRQSLENVTGAITQLTILLKTATENSDDRFETIKALHLQSAGMAQLVASLASATSSSFDQLREDLRQINRDRSRP